MHTQKLKMSNRICSYITGEPAYFPALLIYRNATLTISDCHHISWQVVTAALEFWHISEVTLSLCQCLLIIPIVKSSKTQGNEDRLCHVACRGFCYCVYYV